MSELSQYQSFKAIDIHRSEIKNAIYNPRKIDKKSEGKLKKSLKNHGLVETLVWNKTTGNLVGGHQRLNQLDGLEKTQDYMLTVACIEVEEKQEKEINIILNNPNVGGEYDLDILSSLIPDIDISMTGFDNYDLNIIGVETVLPEIEEDTPSAEFKQTVEDKIKAVKDIKALARENNVGKGENYFVVVFSSIEAKDSFMDRISHDKDDRYIKGEVLIKYLNNGTE